MLTQLLSSIKRKGSVPSASQVWGAEADTSRHVSPGCALAGASYLLCADSIRQLGVLHMCFILLAPRKILSLHYVHYPEPWLMKSHLQPCPQRLVDCASTQLLQRGSEKTSRTPGRPCSVQSHLTSPLLTRLWVEQTAIGIPNRGVEHEPPR